MLKNFIAPLIKDIKAPSVGVVVVKQDETLVNEAFGLADVENNVSATSNSMFKLASVTKHFTAFGIMRLVESGALTLDKRVSDFFPQYPNLDSNITVRHLLNHTSGIQSFTEIPEQFAPFECIEATHEQMLSVFMEQPLLFKPGHGHEYSNSGYYLLGVIIEQISGLSYEDFFTKEFFKPLKMDSTCYCYDRKIIPNRVRGYDAEQGNSIETGLKNCEYINMNPPFAGGGLCSSTNDLTKWCHAIVNGNLLKPESLQQIFSPTPLANGEVIDYGFGLRTYLKNELSSVGHEGGIPGFLSMFMYYPKQKTAIAVLANSTSSDPWLLEEKIAEKLFL